MMSYCICFVPHTQVDASVSLVLTHDASLQIQGLNLNNAVFGFNNGNRTAQFSNQRENYARSAIVSVRYGFGAAPGTRRAALQLHLHKALFREISAIVTHALRHQPMLAQQSMRQLVHPHIRPRARGLCNQNQTRHRGAAAVAAFELERDALKPAKARVFPVGAREAAAAIGNKQYDRRQSTPREPGATLHVLHGVRPPGKRCDDSGVIRGLGLLHQAGLSAQQLKDSRCG